MKTSAKTIGFNNGYRTRRRQAGRNASDFLSKPCNRFTMPPQKRSKRTAGTRTLARQKCWPQFDEEILARWPRLWQRIAVAVFLALLMSGILPMAVATFQIWLGDTYGLWLTALCIAVDAAVIVWLVKRHA
ncbi:hypothetical protein [Adlercreutzia caecimuris]|uniref:hypothetical protein n=1 Tax=Adlercreutzia caecimuris TaxID=671266 RepID=UPI00272BF005|nr:hypothetical protein [Adlercreutzia caecimuris]